MNNKPSWRKLKKNEKVKTSKGIIKGKNTIKKATEEDRSILNAIKKRKVDIYIKEENGEIKSVLFDLK